MCNQIQFNNILTLWWLRWLCWTPLLFLSLWWFVYQKLPKRNFSCRTADLDGVGGLVSEAIGPKKAKFSNRGIFSNRSKQGVDFQKSFSQIAPYSQIAQNKQFNEKSQFSNRYHFLKSLKTSNFVNSLFSPTKKLTEFAKHILKSRTYFKDNKALSSVTLLTLTEWLKQWNNIEGPEEFSTVKDRMLLGRFLLLFIQKRQVALATFEELR